VGTFGGVDAVPAGQLASNTQIYAELGRVSELTQVRSVLYATHTGGDAPDRETPR
jgi:hypothetical protein